MTMDMSRFEALADAYGGDLRRWPATEREDARWFVAEQEALTRPILAHADALDALLWEASAATPSQALHARILAAAPGPHVMAGHSRLWRWLLGAGVGGILAASCAAGLAVGTAAAPAALARLDRIGGGDPAGEAARLLREPADTTEG